MVFRAFYTDAQLHFSQNMNSVISIRSATKEGGKELLESHGDINIKLFLKEDCWV